MSCPALEELEQFANGRETVGGRAALEAHVAGCPECRERCSEIQQNLKLAERVAAAPPDAGESGALTITNAASPSVDRAAPLPSIPGYQILRVLSHGGQGVVYQALQEETKRKVAIKVLLEGPLAAPALRRRFEREIELAAQLRHPHIVSVFHSGLTIDGRQYLVMDYIRGTPLTAYVREQKPALEAALSAFAAVCDAVQHAHQRGVIHRDLKPSNILVDVEGQPRVLDFGLAKRLGGADETLATMSQQLLGTLPYMSPEQTRGNPDEIDTRSDVYSLGVVLYEMLTGQFPYPVVGAMADVLHNIAQMPAAPPSRQWRSGRGVEERTARRLRPGQCPIDGELETIVLKALAKERERRYQSAGELARDIRHYLAGEPIEARRDSGLYVVRKALYRYRVGLGVLGVLLLGAGGFAVALGVQANRLQRERDRAQQAEQLAQERLGLAQASEQSAQRATREAEQVNQFLLDMIGGADPRANRSERTVGELLDSAADALRSDPPDDPAVRAAIHHAVSVSYRGLGTFQESERHAREAVRIRAETLGLAHKLTLQSRNEIGVALLETRRPAEAEQEFRAILAAGGKAFAEDPLFYVYVTGNLAQCLHEQGDSEQAERLYREALARLEELPAAAPQEVLRVRNRLAAILLSRQNWRGADEVLAPAAALLDAPEIADVFRLETLNLLAAVAALRGELRLVEELTAKGLAIAHTALSADHPDVLVLRHRLARTAGELGRVDEARAELAALVDRPVDAQSANDAERLWTVHDLAELLLESGDVDAAAGLIQSARNTAWDPPRDVAIAFQDLQAGVQLARGQFDAAQAAAEQVLQVRESLLGAHHSRTARAEHRLGTILLSARKLRAAEQALRGSITRLAPNVPESHWLIARFRSDLGACLLQQDRPAEAAAELERSVVSLGEALGPAHPLTQRAAERLAGARSAMHSAADSAVRPNPSSGPSRP